MKKSMEVLKIKNITTLWSSHSISGYLPEEIWNAAELEQKQTRERISVMVKMFYSCSNVVTARHV